MICNHCKKDFPPDDIFVDFENEKICYDCFDIMMEQESKDFEAYNSQNGKCALCGKKTNMWHVVDGKMICHPSCDKTKEALKLGFENGKIVAING